MAKMIICPYCAAAVPEGADTCPGCGGPTKKTAAAPGVQPYFGHGGASTCPSCGVPVGAGDIVCVKCGVNLLTGQKVEKQAPPVKRDLQWVAQAVKVSAFLLLAVCCAVAVFFIATVLLRDPVGGARRAAQAGNLEESADLLQRHLQRAPHDVDAQFLLGQVYWQGQRYDRAWEVFESVARQGGPRDREAAMLAVMASERIPGGGNRQRPVALLRSLIQERHPNDEELNRLLALLQGVEGEYKAQREAVEALIAFGAALPPVVPGLARALNDDLEGAEQNLTQALSDNPEDASLSVALGFVQKMRGNDDAAMISLERAANASGSVASLVNLQRGALLMQQGNYGKALPLLTEARKALPEDMRCAFLYAVCLQHNKLLDEALVAFETIAGGDNPFAGQAALEMAVIYLEQGAFDRAATYARRAGEAGLATARQATVLGRVMAMQSDMNQAEQAYRRAISISGEYPAARLELGLLLVNRGAVEEGLQELEQYLELAQTNPVQYRANEIEVLVAQIRQTRQ